MSRYRQNTALLFLGMISFMLSVACIPHSFAAHADEIPGAFPVYAHDLHAQEGEEGVLHLLSDWLVNLSESHRHTAHGHLLILPKGINKAGAVLLFALLLLPFITLHLFVPAKPVRPCYRDISPPLWRIYLSTLITRGPPALI
jgi:hypothetical protein